MADLIDDVDRRILFELDKNCRISDNQIAKIVNKSRETIRYRIKKLQDIGILNGFITSINPSKYGYMFFKLYFQLANIPKRRERFFKYMSDLPGMYWIGGNDGVWDSHVTIYAKNVKEFYKLKNKIFSDFKDLIIKRDIGVLVNVRQYKKKFLVSENVKDYNSYAMFSDDIVFNKIDKLDRKIINILINNARIPLVHLAKRVKSTPDIIRNRMKKLEKKGIIIQYRVSIDFSKLDYEYFKAFLYFNNLSEEDEKKLVTYAANHPKIIYLIRQLSSWDVELELICKDYEEFTSIMNEIRKNFVKSLRNYESVLMNEDIWVFSERDIFK
jgi:Lrp/AsnC family transcriptional regulator for asnA, asnC and gidA